MFKFLKKKTHRYAPVLSSANPGQGIRMEVGFSDDQGHQRDQVNLLDSLASTLRGRGIAFRQQGDWLQLSSNGLWLQPQFLAALHSAKRGGVQTSTTLQVCHETLLPLGSFEYQHANGDTVRESFSTGFENWARVDLVVFCDALAKKPESCSSMEMSFPPPPAAARRHRRVLLGPTAHMAARAAPKTVAPHATGAGENHPFCRCCLLTHSLEAFKPLLDSDGVHGVRLFAARDDNGVISTDCRVDGEDWVSGAQALKKYAESWPDRGFELRKQFVLMHSVDKPGTAVR